MHWVEVVANALGQKEHTIASGTSISGEIHIGNAGDVIIADAIARVLAEKGCAAKVLWFVDDTDPFRKVPANLPVEFEKYLGLPVNLLPCPKGCCASFVEHFKKPFLDALQKIGVSPQVISSAEMYNKGVYNDAIRTALKNAEKIRTIFKDIAGAVKPSDWLPFQPVCESCRKIATTKPLEYENDKIHYECTGGFVGGQKIKGCGYSGTTAIRNGKLAWRVEWAARWKIFRITCEPFGKDHAAAGGSYDTSKKIVVDVFNYPPPYPVVYEHILFGTKKMSKSAGLVVTLNEFLNSVPPEITRYFYFRTKVWRHKEFSMLQLPVLAEEYESAERIYFGVEECKLEKELPDIRKAYELAQVEKIPAKIEQVPFSHLLSVVQISDRWDDILARLQRSGYCKQLDDWCRQKIIEKIDCAKYWLHKYGGEELKFSIQARPPQITLTADELNFLIVLRRLLEKTDWSAVELHNCVYQACEGIIDRKNAFKLLYKIFINKEKGPKLGYFLATLEKDFVLERLSAYC